MRPSGAAALWIGKYAGGGIVSYGTPRLLVAAGVPLDRWIVVMGAWLSIHMDREIALWGATVIIGCAIYGGSILLSKDHDWKPTVPTTIKRLWAKVEPLHIIILGVVITAIGIGWQLYRGAPQAQIVNSGQKVTVATEVIRAPSPEVVANIKAPLQAEIDSLKQRLVQQPKTTTPAAEPKPATPEIKYGRTEANEIIDALNEMQNTVSVLEAALSRYNWNSMQAASMLSGSGPGSGRPPIKVTMQQTLDRIQELDAANQKTEKELEQILKKYSAHKSVLKTFTKITTEPTGYQETSSELRNMITIALRLEHYELVQLMSALEPAAQRYAVAGFKHVSQVNDLLKKIETKKEKIRESL